MRRVAAAMLAAPILLLVYAASAVRRPMVRVGAALFVLGVVALWSALGGTASRATADQPLVATPLPVAAFREIHVRQGLRAPVLLSFSQPMDEASVRSALRVEPSVAVDLTFDPTGRSATIAPVGRWDPETYYSVSVGSQALDRSGHALSADVRTAFLTRPSGAARLAVTGEEGGAVPLTARFIVSIEGDVDPAELVSAVQVTPAVPGTVSVTGADEASARGGAAVLQAVFTPTAPLAAGATYTISLASLVDRDGASLIEPPALAVTTAAAPSVVRFRPRAGSTGVALTSAISVRFTQSMDRPSTVAAFSVTVGGKPVTGKLDWSERDTVLVFTPASSLGYSQTVAASVAGTALSSRGVPLNAAASASFTTIPKPAAKPASKPASKPAAKPVPIPSGGTVASGTWAAVEAYYLRLLNCTRTGGWVTTSGACLAGSNGTPPVVMNAGLQTRVARPYAKVLATTGACSHTAGGTTFAGRLAAGGFSGYIWAGENVGCGNGDPYKAMLADHLFFQNEKSTNGGHYRNIMDPRFRWVGVAVWVYGGTCRLVTDFLDP